MAVSLKASVRTETGKGAARRIRRADLMPAVVYGGKTEPISITTSPKEFTRVLLGPLRRNTVIELDIDDAGKSQKHQVMVRDLQVDVVRRNPRHADFVTVDSKVPVIVRIPFRAEGGRSAAMIAGGNLEIASRDIGVRVLPGKIPAAIVVDTVNLEYGAFRASDVTMPDGCELIDDGNNTVLTVKQPRGSTDEEDEAAAAAAEPAADAAAE